VDAEEQTGNGVGEDALLEATGRLIDRLGGVSGSWFGARIADGSRTRAERLRELVLALAVLGRKAGNGAPDGMVPNAVGVHALADQVAVLVDEVRRGPDLSSVSGEATQTVRACYDDLWLPGPARR
jgi:hypothetical protein